MTNKEKLRLLYINAVLNNNDPNFIVEQTRYMDDLTEELEMLDLLKKNIKITEDYKMGSDKVEAITMLLIEDLTIESDKYIEAKRWLEK